MYQTEENNFMSQKEQTLSLTDREFENRGNSSLVMIADAINALEYVNEDEDDKHLLESLERRFRNIEQRQRQPDEFSLQFQNINPLSTEESPRYGRQIDT
jgi:hypothetical protein